MEALVDTRKGVPNRWDLDVWIERTPTPLVGRVYSGVNLEVSRRPLRRLALFWVWLGFRNPRTLFTFRSESGESSLGGPSQVTQRFYGWFP